MNGIEDDANGRRVIDDVKAKKTAVIIDTVQRNDVVRVRVHLNATGVVNRLLVDLVKEIK